MLGLSSGAQDTSDAPDDNVIPEVVDSLYREDQFYLGLSFNLINNEPQAFSQNGFSGGLHLGFIRDMPINKRRNLAIGLGLGLSSNIFNSNLLISDTDTGKNQFSILENRSSINTNRFHTNLIEVPLEFRWRTSTATRYDFWRIYGGIVFGYMYAFRSKFDDNGVAIIKRNLEELNRFRFAGSLSVGNGGFNAFIKYDLQTLFNKNAVTVSGDRVNLQPIKFGIMFYFL